MNRTFIVMSLCLGVPAPLVAQAVDEKTATEICERFASWKPGPDARPTEEDRKLVVSKELVGVRFVETAVEKKEYDEARRYCLVTGDCNLQLAMIFANGWGVRRDYDAATLFLCRCGDDTMGSHERQEMLGHLESMRMAAKPLDLLYCDHVLGVDGDIYCKMLAEERGADRMTKVRQKLSPGAAPMLDQLVTAINVFAEAESSLRAFGYGGSGYLRVGVSENRRIYEEQVSAVERLTESRLTGSNPEDLKRADAELNKAYRLAIGTPREPGPGRNYETWAATLRDTQRAWIRFRDAWAAFYVAVWRGKADPEALKREITYEMTRERSVQLDEIYTED